MKKLILFIAMMMLVACTQAPAEGDLSLKTIEDNGKMIVGFTEYPPMGFKENGEITGFDIDIAKEVAERLGVEAEFVYIDWDAKVLELNGKNIDMIWNGLTITADREKEILFSKPYFDNRIVIISLNGSGIDQIADLSEMKVGVE